MTVYLERLGPIITLADGLRIQDLAGGCGRCSKRLAEVIHDPTSTWNEGQVVCLDCSYIAPPTVRPDHHVQVMPAKSAPSKRIGVCRCGRVSMITTARKAAEWAEKHRLEHTRGAA